MRYGIVIDRAESNYAAFAPDLPSRIAAGYTVAEVEQRIREAIQFHIEGLREDGIEVLAPTAICELLEG